jgi:ABC-2 type transport system permease protein
MSLSRRGSYRPLRELTLTRVREFFREPEAIFWVYVFPILLAVGLGIAFRSHKADTARVAVVEPAAGSAAEDVEGRSIAERLGKDPRFKVELRPRDQAIRDLSTGRVDLVIERGEEIAYLYDPARPEGALARQWADDFLQRAEGRRDPLPAVDRPVSEPGGRYIDFLIPGLLGMNIMGGGLWGVGFVIVDMRVRKLLKRLLATPMRKTDFLLSIVGSRLFFLVPEIALLLLVGRLGFGVPLRGSLASVAAIVFLAGLSFSGMGLLVASRAAKIETVSGLMNVVMLPMWILSGIFFSRERFPDALQPLIQALPLTATIDALRAVMLDGRALASQAAQLGILTAWGAGSFVLSLRWFRWL